MTDKTYEYEGVKLVKVPEPDDSACLKCYFFNRNCYAIIFDKLLPSCIEGKDSNTEDMIFVEVEPVNKIEEL